MNYSKKNKNKNKYIYIYIFKIYEIIKSFINKN